MHQSAASIALMPALDARRPLMKARLALAEFLLASGDLHVSARQCLDWLARHAGVRQALVAVVDPDSPHLLIVAEHGIEPGMSNEAIADLVIGPHDSTHPLVLAMELDEPTYFARASGVYTPLAGTGFHAIPLRSDDEARAYGILLAASSTAEIDPDVAWLTRQLSRQVARLCTRQGTYVASILCNITDLAHARAEIEERYRALRLAQLERKVREATAELAQQNDLLRRQHIELEQASALKSQFLANISHEFRTPLNAILGYTHMLLQGVTGALTEPQRKSLTRIDSNSRHLLALINDILDITRIEAGRMPLNVTSFRIADLVDEMMSELEPIIQRSNLAVTARMGCTLPAVKTDRQKVKQIVLNLLSNALKFTPTGSITIGATFESKGRMVAIAVRDTGVGIPEESRSKIFEDFRQLDNSPARGYGGTGLGLPICRRLAKMLGGSIDLESQVGEGSTFTLRLPVHAHRR
jgi:two-component system cell cycle sensor histidine kinase PleC